MSSLGKFSGSVRGKSSYNYQIDLNVKTEPLIKEISHFFMLVSTFLKHDLFS